MHQQFTLRLTRVVGALALSVIFAASAMAVAHEAPPPICTDERGAEKEKCSPSRHPESLDELTTLHRDRASHLASPFAFAPMGAHASALRERMTLATTPSSIPNANGTWRPYGKTPLIANHRDYRSVNQLGFVHLGGRIDDLFYDESSGRLFAAFGSGGGVWLSENKGDFWRPIGESLPTQVVASVAWTAAAGGRVLALTGEPTFGHYSQTGLGAYYSDDLGTTWNKASGIPDGMFGFKLAIDPVNPGIVYAATGRGLYRSADGGASYADVVLPTGACAGKFDLSTCLFANIVTDVVVQAPDNFGNPGGAVMAAVGWRAGRAKNPNGSEQSTGNGIYVSPSGEPGTFVQSINGFTPQERIGRTELGIASGKNQNHDYVYAIVQDAVLLQGGVPVIDAPEEIGFGLNNTVLHGVYVSSDFGQTWTQMADDNRISGNPLSGSTLKVLAGVQAWYNLFIQPDPTRQDSKGVPTRLVFGLEEVWQNELTNLPQNGPSSFRVIGRYYTGGTCVFLSSDVPACPGDRPPYGTTTTHPDQHDAIFIPELGNGVTLAIGGDGGFFRQTAGAAGEFDNGGWGDGANEGFHTLLPYATVISKDGTVWMGLQDNGTAKITSDGTQYMTLGGDGFFVAVDPDNSEIAYGEQTYGSMDVTTNGGKTWRSIDPFIYGTRFSNPFVMDPLDANHLMTAGTPIVETIHGPDTGTTDDNDWVEVFNLGTRDRPGEPPGEDIVIGRIVSGDINQMTALDLHGSANYVGFCSSCDVLVSGGVAFRNGLATNAGGSKPPKPMTSDGWHIAAAQGLPNRMITAVAIDPSSPDVVYIGLGGYSRRWTPPGSLDQPTEDLGTGHLYVSKDAGATFTDLSGNLPDTPVTALEVYGNGQLVVGTDLGVFIGGENAAPTYTVLGTGMPISPVSTLQVAPSDPTAILAATFGRGVYLFSPTTTQVKGIKLAATGAGVPSGIPLGLVLIALGVLVSRLIFSKA